MEELFDYINEVTDGKAVLFRAPDFASAIIGISHDDRVVYDYNKMIEYLIRERDLSEQDARDYIDYNILNTHVEHGPVVLMCREMFE